MEITLAATPSSAKENSILTIKAGDEETIRVGQMISIELTDESFTEREIISMERWFCPEGAKRGKWKAVDHIENGESAEVTVENLHSNTVQTTSMPSHEERKRRAQMICLTPYKELSSGEESIHDHIREGYKVPDKVIAYLRTTKPYAVCMGIYDHPFKEGTTLLGPYYYTDDKYYWDRDTWKYVVKYGLELPQAFIDHVMSEEGTKFIEQQIEENESWSDTIKQWKKQKGLLCLMPDDAGDKDLEDF